uniref:Innate immunity activator n=1 Tax=Chrysolophus pictus TaxID=9089 RepID=A0A8C3LGJ1_CHRPC
MQALRGLCCSPAPPLLSSQNTSLHPGCSRAAASTVLTAPPCWHPGPGSPTAPLKELAQRVRRQQQALELCVQELRRLCLREAELTGTLPQEFPLKAGEKPPKVRRRIGAAFKLDESLVLRGADPLGALERDLALQMQIARAAHRLCREENISKQLRRRRKTAALKEEQKLKALEDTLLAERRALSAGGTGGAQEEAQPMGAGTPQRLPSPCPWPRLAPEEQSEDPGCPSAPPGPWRETSLDGPYGKAKNISAEPGDGETCASRCCPTSPPAVTSVPISPDCRAGDVAPYRFIPIRSVVLCRQMGSSAPSTPEPAIRRGQCQSLRVDSRWEPGEMRGRSTAPRRRPTYYTVTVPTSCPPAPSPTPRSGSLPGQQQPRRLLPTSPSPTTLHRTHFLPPRSPPAPATPRPPGVPL